MFDYDDIIDMLEDENEEEPEFSELVKCDVCGKHFANIRSLGDQFYYTSHYEFGVCSVECWAEHEDFCDEYRVQRWCEEWEEVSQIIAEHWNKSLNWDEDEENI